jgi:hypothetical protein
MKIHIEEQDIIVSDFNNDLQRRNQCLLESPTCKGECLKCENRLSYTYQGSLADDILDALLNTGKYSIRK